ncbi:MAG TPA: UPF0149 family protein [Thiotrichaceae bacterium]|jgi:uncharacterized protein YgfB (UPF0149 family)|nr:UPF0149 family protein [Thiotrichaceae bacterium]HIM08544.1 hypothetical protein [Gammaproteobacteria bacterium]
MKVDYDEMNAELGAVHAGVRASECHGFFCGHFCTSNTVVAESWQDHLLAGIDDAVDLEDCSAVLTRLANQVKEEILAEEISFNLLLPDDTSTISQRSAALAEWCAGFVSGLGIGGLGEKPPLIEECDEFIKDLVSISRMETMVEDNEESESAFFEIVEYIRVGTIMLHQEWHQVNINSEKPKVLH